MTIEKTLPSSSLQGVAWRLLLWALAWLPAMVVLFWIIHLRIRVPYHDSWAFVEQYKSWVEHDYGWRDLLRPHNGHPAVVGKLVYFAALHGLGGNVSLLPLLSWALSLVIAGSVYLLARPLWSGTLWQGPVLMGLANLSIFTAAQGHTWIWDFVFQNYIAGTCLILALVLLRPAGACRPSRVALAFFLGVVATFSFGSGFLVGLLLLPAVWCALPEAWSGGRRWALLAGWAFGIIVIAWVALFAFRQTSSGVRPLDAGESVIDRPVMAAKYVLVLLGHTIGQGTVLEAVTVCAWVGGALLLILCAILVLLGLRCRAPAVWRACLPWIICCGWAIGNAGIICMIRMEALLDTALAPRYAAFMLFMVLGVVFLVATLWRHPVARPLLPAAFTSPTLPAVGGGVLIVGHLLGWAAGYQSLLLYHERMVSEVAAMDFALVLPVNREVQWDNSKSQLFSWLMFLKDQGRLKGVKFLADTRLSLLKQGPPLNDKFASFELAQRGPEGGWVASGTCALSKDRVRMADLVLLTVTVSTAPAEERIFAFAAPRLPDDFLQRMLLRRQFPSHYLGWETTFNQGVLPKGEEVEIKAYAYDGATRRVRRLPGSHKMVIPDRS